METLRQSKVSRMLQRELGDIFLKEKRHLLEGAMVTVTIVRISRDFSVAKVYLSVFGINNKKTLLSKISAQSKEIRHALGSKIKNQVRVIPELHFHLDDSLDYIDHIDKLLND
ncbi:MAG: 30S ribosome-binding factor RbfA [Bacteroidales bacterium]|jgi:ribosome-binding factor A|nr:30S ribosome-binding factor RbfA [Bacteroidales bacterium]